MIVWQDGLALSWILLQTLYISLSQGTKLFSLKALLFLSGFKGTGNWLPFLSQARNTRCIKNDNSIQKYMSNWITHKNPNLTVHTYKEGFDILSYLSEILNQKNVLLFKFVLKFKLKHRKGFNEKVAWYLKISLLHLFLWIGNKILPQCVMPPSKVGERSSIQKTPGQADTQKAFFSFFFSYIFQTPKRPFFLRLLLAKTLP